MMRDEGMQTLTRAASALVMLVVGGLALSVLGVLPSGVDVDTDERRHYVLRADTSVDRAVIDVHVRSNVRDIIKEAERERVNTTWQYSFWAEASEIVYIRFRVETYGALPFGEGAWARCEVILNGEMADTEVDQRPVVQGADDRYQQAGVSCGVTAG